MNVVADLATVLVVAVGIAIGFMVYRWTEPAPNAAIQSAKGERLAWAVGAAAAVIVVGGFLMEGITVEVSPDSPAAGVSSTPTPSVPPAESGK
ncbi:hypothetical protein SUDANB105_08076 (plasmid) [Streptomyces sp. enrichment culture]|uniref:hypothetical protein n=1 Tax=Streptomyces sp. enrichment culture TaxID=1795815 RepID=UPI003F55CD52